MEDNIEEERHFNKFQLLELVDGTGGVDDGLNEDGSNDPQSAEEDDDGAKKQSNKSSNPKGAKSKTRKRRKNRSRRNVNNDIGLDSEIVSIHGAQKKEETSDQADCSRFKLLKVDMRKLQPEAELKRIFGKSVIREDKLKIRHHPSANLQRSRFVSSGYFEIKPASPMSGPKMDVDEVLNDQINTDLQSKSEDPTKNKLKESAVKFSIENSDRPVYFKFIHDKSYQEAQKLFLEAVHRGHPESILQNLSIFPFHAESLIQLSHMTHVSEDYKTASEFIERALLVFERGFHPRFNLASANCRLTYRRPENRAFFIAIFKHITYCHRRGLRRTPLEYAKLLLSLEPESDPLLASQLVDFFAIRSEEYDFLIEFVSKWQHLSKLPNMQFSLSLAHFLKSRCTKLTKAESSKSLEQADECLRRALLLFPNFVVQLLDACSAEPDSELKKCNYFDYSVYSNKYKLVPETIDVLVNLYVKRNFILWKPKYVLSWLEQNVATMVSKFATGELTDEGLHTEHWSSLKKPVPRNLLRHLVLSDLDLKIPASASNTTFLDIDPYPPSESIISYEIAPTTSRNHMERAHSGGMSSLFLRSMLPSFRFGGEQQASSTTNNSIGSNNLQFDSTDAGNHEILLGDFVPDEAFEEIPDGNETEFNELRNSIHDLVVSVSNFLSLTPLIRAHMDRLNRDSDSNDRNNPNERGGS